MKAKILSVLPINNGENEGVRISHLIKNVKGFVYVFGAQNNGPRIGFESSMADHIEIVMESSLSKKNNTVTMRKYFRKQDNHQGLPLNIGFKDFPLVELELDHNSNNPTEETCQAVTSALRDSGFLIIKTNLLPLELQQRSLSAASSFLDSSSEQVVTHPQDPKKYAMLEGIKSIPAADSSINSLLTRQDLQDWYGALRKTKTILLQCIAVGLGMKDTNYFVKLHDEDNDALRLIKYQPGDTSTGNRCKEHSDYGTLTLLLNDGIGGLEAYVDDQWKAVPYVEGGIVVNIGSILSEWTRQELKATLHRVAGPSSIGSTTPQDVLLKAVSVPRISLAYFADPNKNVSTVLEDTSSSDGKEVGGDSSKMSIEEYIQYRSGGQGDSRSGVAFTSTEESRLGI